MLHDEARVLLIESCEKTHHAEEIAKIFGWLIASIILQGEPHEKISYHNCFAVWFAGLLLNLLNGRFDSNN